MLLKRQALLATLPATTFDDTRYALHAIQIDPKAHAYTSTNGNVLLRVVDREPVKDSEFPNVPGAPFDHDPETILIPAPVAKQIASSLPKTVTIPVLGMAQLSANGDPDTCTIAVTDLDTPQVRTITPIDGLFPKHEAVIKAPTKAVRLCVSTAVLKVLIKAVDAVSQGAPSARVTLTIPTSETNVTGSVRFDTAGADGLELSGALMGMRI